jgi:non-ribosomal peptide synthase protein (TIGR01720 family)
MSSRLARQELVTGSIPLSPIQNAFFQRDPADKHHFNQSVLLYSPIPVSEEGLKAALDKMLLHHDALRMVYRKTDGAWIQEGRGTEHCYSLEIITASNEESFTAHCERIQAGIDLEKGPLFKVALFQGTAGDRLLLVAHHLVIDGVSWRILFEDLSVLYLQYLSGDPLTLPLKTDAFRDWQHSLLQYAESGALEKEDAYWTGMATPVRRLPQDNPQGSNLVKDVASCSFTLDQHTTGQLLTRCYKAYRTEINDVLLTAAGLALAEVFELDKVLVNMEGHGREPLGADLDVSRTVGWFTSVYPVVLDMRYRKDMIRQLIEIKEHLHRVPRKGTGYGVLRSLKGRQYNIWPEITFNYLGDFGRGVNSGDDDQLFTFSTDYHGREMSANMQRPVLLDISGMVTAGCLRISISYSSKQYVAARMEQLLACFRQQLVALIEELSTEEGMHLSPVDLTFKELSITQLEKLKNRL